MKCIKCIKETKNYKLNEIRRVNDKDADEKVTSGNWKFIPKEEWKKELRDLAKTKKEEVVEEVKQEKTISEKVLQRNKTKVK
jgi:hypothetical protein